MDKDSDIRHVRIHRHEAAERPKTKKRRFGRKSKISLFVALFFLVIIGWTVISTGSSVFTYVFSQGQPLRSSNDRVNVLLLGLAGGNHDGALLTDSIIVVSYNLKINYVTWICVPRDLCLIISMPRLMQPMKSG